MYIYIYIMDINRTGLRICHVTPYRQGDRPPFVLGAAA